MLKAGHSQNDGEPMDLGLEMIAEHLQEATGGKATLEVFPNMQLGGEVEMIKQVLTGSLDITSPSNAPLTNFVPELKLFDMPFLFRDQDHMIAVLRGPVLQEINNVVAKRGIRLLGVYNVGVRHLMTKEPVMSIEDLQGLKIRTMQSKYHMAAWNAFGANATPISYAELYSSLQTGVVDGAEAANTNYYEKKFYEVAPNWGQVGWTILTAPIIMSEEKFQSLPADVQTALLEGGAKAAEWEQESLRGGGRGAPRNARGSGRKDHGARSGPVPRGGEEGLRRVPHRREREAPSPDDPRHEVGRVFGPPTVDGRTAGRTWVRPAVSSSGRCVVTNVGKRSAPAHSRRR